MLKVGLTGGIGSGKTAVANLFKKKGIPIVDADKVSHDLSEPGKAGYLAMIDQFGTDILDSDQKINRSMLRKIVFTSPAEKQKLESSLHPLIYSEIDARIDLLDSPYCIVCVPLLLETGHQNRVNRILVVDCPPEIQIERVQSRDNVDAKLARRIINSQISRKKRLSAADDIIKNNADYSWLDLQVEKLHNFYLQNSVTTGPAN